MLDVAATLPPLYKISSYNPEISTHGMLDTETWLNSPATPSAI